MLVSRSESPDDRTIFEPAELAGVRRGLAFIEVQPFVVDAGISIHPLLVNGWATSVPTPAA